MDIVRSCSTQRLFWDAAQTVFSDVTWYFAPPGAKVFPGWHRFSSEAWDRVHWFNDGAGFDARSVPRWSNGKLPGPFKGQSICGKPEWFVLGAPSDAPPLERNAAGLPVCCFGRGAYADAYSDAWDTFRGNEHQT